MIAKIGHGTNIMGAIAYNHNKVAKENGSILLMNKMCETPDGRYSAGQLYRSFEPYLIANKRTEKPALHISLNPDPKDNVSDETFIKMVQDYMQEMGYGNQPYVVFKHMDIERTHIHIVSTNVDQTGKKISDTFEKRRSMEACRNLEEQYSLMPAAEKQRQEHDKLFRPVDYGAGDIKSQIASVVRHLPKYYQFQGLGAYNALLSLFNVTAEPISGELQGQPKQGLVYFALNGHGEKTGHPFKSSLFGKHAGLSQLQQHFEKSKTGLKNHPTKSTLKNTVEVAMRTSSSENEFKVQLINQGINTIVRRNDEGRVYGITFVDHEHKNVWNGSAFGKEFSANVFNDWWNGERKPQPENEYMKLNSTSDVSDKALPDEAPHDIFDFLQPEKHSFVSDEDGVMEGLGGLLLQEAQGDDAEELAFERRVKRRRKKWRER